MGALSLRLRVCAALAAVLSALVCAAPALASGGDPSGTVGPGQVVTDPASETEPAPGDGVPVPGGTATTVTEESPPSDDQAPRRDEPHAVGTGTAQPGSTPAATGPAAVAPSASAAPATSAAPSPGGASAETLPFTGVNAWLVALCGSVLLGSGLLVRRRVA